MYSQSGREFSLNEYCTGSAWQQRVVHRARSCLSPYLLSSAERADDRHSSRDVGEVLWRACHDRVALQTLANESQKPETLAGALRTFAVDFVSRDRLMARRVTSKEVAESQASTVSREAEAGASLDWRLEVARTEIRFTLVGKNDAHLSPFQRHSGQKNEVQSAKTGRARRVVSQLHEVVFISFSVSSRLFEQADEPHHMLTSIYA